MANIEDSVLQIAGIGHVYTAPVGTAFPNLSGFVFGNGDSLPEWEWLGDTSSDSLMEFSTDGGDAESKRTWDRLNVRSVQGDKSTKLTITSVNGTKSTIEVAFGGSQYDETTKSWRIKMDSAVERAVLVVIEDGAYVGGWGFGRVSLSGSLPALALDGFTSFPINGSIMDAPGSDTIRYWEPRMGYSHVEATQKPTLSKAAPANGKPGTSVTLTGTNLVGVTSVMFGDIPAPSFNIASATSMTVTVPKGSGSKPIKVKNAKGESGEQAFTIN